jgi:glycosyltransferase involved in cell wall biosynthesis
LKILIAHNRYQQPGGEDGVVEREAAMLVRGGHQVELLAFDNETITTPLARLQAAARSLYSKDSYRRTIAALMRFQPDILHVHNFLPNLSPSVFFAANAAGVPVVQTLHNYRLLCANALLYREGAPCENCIEQSSFLPGVLHACYRGSRLGSAVVGGGMAIHTALGTWTHRVDRYIALTRFAGQKLSQSRIPPERVRIKPNFIADNGIGHGSGGFALFAGRLSEEKGIDTLLAADALGTLPIPVYIAGDGPLLARIQQAARRPDSRLIILGGRSAPDLLHLMKQAVCLLVPSLFYEGFPLVVVEALSVGLPVIASRIGGLPEIVEDGVSALLHTPGDAAALAGAMQSFLAQPARIAAMRAAARSLYLARYTEAANYQALLHIYQEMLEQNQSLSTIETPERTATHST